MAETDQVLKVDVAGRVWTPRARREEVLDEFERSGMAAVETRAAGLRVELLGGARIEIADEAQAKLAAVLLRALAPEGPRC